MALQQCFERLYSSPPPVSSSSTRHHSHSSHRSPLPYSLFPLQVQRRWSETAAAEMVGVAEAAEQVRRWSMPWDCRHVSLEWPRQEGRSRLRVPLPLQVDRSSRSTTPDSLWKLQAAAATNSSQDGLREAIQLLSCRPGIKVSTGGQHNYHGGHHVPGLTLTTYESTYETCVGLETGLWPDSRPIGSSRCWPHDSHSSDHSDLSGPRDSDHSHRDSGTLTEHTLIYL